MNKDKFYYIEFIRFLAGFNVILIHIHNYSTNNNSSMFINGYGIPLFLLISGFCMFNKPHTYHNQLKKILFKIIIPSVILALITCILNDYILGQKTILGCLKQIDWINLLKQLQSIFLLNFNCSHPLLQHL